MKGILIEENYDLMIRTQRGTDGKIRSGLTVGNVLYQNQALIIGLYKGEIKENPAVGVGISDMLLDHDPLAWRTEIREQLEIDGQKVNKVTVTNSGISVDATY
ncbi:hypothetical protein DW940_14615 [Bacteroides uniformis]|jgi:hypothetical protein|uniref:hypothetical protein n=1 Tax=Bacteroidaceae TaxID=815 RepID=UPI000E551282|nr:MULTISPECIES: hypothetical protein [Bacteroidaceae]RHA30036.1 hypothetical protein DW940_14615 [Bacteroides uniformis]RHA60133.1 hypothetical protein DW935_01115 [Phocaeicola vulgatus]